MRHEDDDEDARREAIDQRRAWGGRPGRCVCDPGHNMPGNCPGAHNCPYSGFADDEPDDDGE